MIKTIILDLGNVIVNVDKSLQYKKFSASSNKPFPYVKEYIENESSRKDFEKGKLTPLQFYQKVQEDLTLNMNFRQFKSAWCDIFALNKSVENLIKKLKTKYRLILLSNTDILHFNYIKNKFRIVGAFDEYVLSYKTGCRKPNPLIFLHALGKAKSLPFNCVYIDDIKEFVYMAKLVGMKSFQYKNFKKLIFDLKSLGILNTYPKDI